MKPIRIAPAVRISLGLVLLTTAILLVGELIGLTPNPSTETLEARKKLCEALAVQLSSAASRNDIPLIRVTLKGLVERNEDVLSAALRLSDGTLLTEAGNHSAHWKTLFEERSTPTHVQVPIFNDKSRWGTVEVSFAELIPEGAWEKLKHSHLGLLIFVAAAGFLLYMLFLRRTLEELDPSKAIPERVQAAFDVLAEGVIVLDETERIVLANSAFADKLGQPVSSLLGRNASTLDWKNPKSSRKPQDLPWLDAMRDDRKRTSVPIALATQGGRLRSFVVNAAPIFDGKGNRRGVLATFDDMTAVEKKNADLQQALAQLERSEYRIRRQNQQLQVLATRDPLTGCLNRRSFFEAFETAFKDACGTGRDIACVMVDVDHFKSVNDRYGHGVGDEVLKSVAEALQSKLRPEDLVGRYGGEEFCLLLPDLSSDNAAAVADRLRRILEQKQCSASQPNLRVTASFGLAVLNAEVKSSAELVNQADKALYEAKESGRNRVICWGQDEQPPAGTQSVAKDIEPGEQQVARTRELQTGPAAGVEPASLEHGAEEVRQLRERVKSLETSLEKRATELKRRPGSDTLTGLPNRVLFNERISQAIARAHRYGGKVALLSMDINMFSRVNNTLGYVVGDRLLKTAGHKITDILRGTDTVAFLGTDSIKPTVSRLTNDEFGILLTDLEDVESVTWIVRRIFDALSEPIEIDSHRIYIDTTIGISVYPSDGDTWEDLLRNAAAAREHAKQLPGRNKYQFYAQEINAQSLAQLELEGELRKAIENEEFLLHYQPKVTLQTGKVAGMEALVRWHHPERGMIPPNEFISLAERTGLIEPIGNWVIRAACRQLRTWVDAGYDDIRVAVNLSVVQLRKVDLAERIIEMLEEVDLHPRFLELEVTESAVMENFDTSAATLQELRRAGFAISIDDFGAGQSSLSYLKRLPADTLKIDRSFMADICNSLQDATIVGYIVSLAHSLGLTAVAEGIESAEQSAVLRDLNCDEAQGYFFSKPVPQEQVGDLLACTMSIGEGPQDRPKASVHRFPLRVDRVAPYVDTGVD